LTRLKLALMIWRNVLTMVMRALAAKG
jgi:hypothetical protein